MIPIKPTMAPLALLGARQQSWWVVFGLTVVVAVPFGYLWLDYLAVVRNAETTLAYQLGSAHLLATPVVAWLGRRRAFAVPLKSPD